MSVLFTLNTRKKDYKTRLSKFKTNLNFYSEIEQLDTETTLKKRRSPLCLKTTTTRASIETFAINYIF